MHMNICPTVNLIMKCIIANQDQLTAVIFSVRSCQGLNLLNLLLKLFMKVKSKTLQRPMDFLVLTPCKF
uniref:Uncharacterized protein n=1 Tax=Arundo donax TaxID=35708 RepID=A0A0A9C3Q4_ARUDO